MSVSIEERVARYMAKLDPAVAGQHGHDTTFHAASVLVHGFGLNEDRAWPFALEYNARCMPPWSERELRRKLTEAIRKPSDRPRGYLLGGCHVEPPLAPPEHAQPAAKPAYDPDKLKRVADRLPKIVNAAYLEARSKFTCWNRSPAGFLHKLYRPGERILIFTTPFSQGSQVWEHPGACGNLGILDDLRRGCEEGVWFLAQPVTGEFVELERLQSERNPSGRSRRCEECVTSWRYAVAESDEADSELWLRAFAQMPLPIAAIYSSGGRSIHSLIRIDARSKAEWDAVVRGKLLSPLVQLGADPGAMTAVRLTRLPGCMREEKHQEQKLLFLDDQPDGTPICERTPREEPEAVWLRWAHSLIYWHGSGEIEPGAIEACLMGLRQFSDILAAQCTIRTLETLHAD